MAVCIIIYSGLGAGFSLLKLHPLELGSCLKSCNRNEQRFPGKGNANLPTKCSSPGSVSYSHPGTLSLDRTKAFFQVKIWDVLPGIRHWICPSCACKIPVNHLRKQFKMLWKLKE